MPKIRYYPCRGWVVIEDHKIIAQAATEERAKELAARLESAKPS